MYRGHTEKAILRHRPMKEKTVLAHFFLNRLQINEVEILVLVIQQTGVGDKGPALFGMGGTYGEVVSALVVLSFFADVLFPEVGDYWCVSRFCVKPMIVVGRVVESICH